MTREELKKAFDEVTKLRNDARTKMVEVGRLLRTLRDEEEDLAKAKEELDRVERRKSTLDTETKVKDRLELVASGDIPLSPEKDRRTVTAAAAGTAGLLLPGAALLALGLVHQRRFHYSDQANDHLAPELLGILPELDGDEPDADSVAAAGRCIHQARVTIQAANAARGSGIYLVTSSTPGEGKTSLAVSLAVSFAASGARTLLVDADFVARHLTRSLGAKNRRGLFEAAQTGTLAGLVAKAAFGMYVLPAGQAEAGDACRLSAPALRRLFDEARRYFDVVLVDSGPVLGSVEAATVAREADGVVFTMARGQERSLVEAAIGRLRQLGAHVDGVVFNRAAARDFSGSIYSSSSRLASRAGGPAEGGGADLGALAGFGPLVRAAIAGLHGGPAGGGHDEVPLSPEPL